MHMLLESDSNKLFFLNFLFMQCWVVQLVKKMRVLTAVTVIMYVSASKYLTSFCSDDNIQK